MSPRQGIDLRIVLEHAARIADENGIEAVTLASVASALNIRTPSLYNHVNGLPGLRAQLALAGIREMRDRMAKAAIGKAKEDAVHALARAYITFAKERPGLYESTIYTPVIEDTEIAAASGEVIEVLVEVFAGFGLHGDDALHLIRGLRSLLHGFASLERRGGFGLALNLDDSVKRNIDIFLTGMKVLQ